MSTPEYTIVDLSGRCVAEWYAPAPGLRAAPEWTDEDQQAARELGYIK